MVVSDVLNVKLASDENTFILQVRAARKNEYTFINTHLHAYTHAHTCTLLYLSSNIHAHSQVFTQAFW